jgi:predicted RNA-binding Zn-ribbon protein involved in translation (DUF1610 family)
MNSLNAYAAGFVRFQPKRSVVEWAEASVELSPRITEQPGPYSTRMYPYVREVLEAVGDPNVRRVSLCWGSQTSKTTSFYIMLGYVIDQAPAPILWVFPSALLCRNFASERWLPFCAQSSVLEKHLPRFLNGDIDVDRFSLLKQEFTRCTMNLVGAGSQANVRSYPISILVLDEIDVIDEGVRRECLDRIKGKRSFKVLQSSTPVSEEGGIWQEFNEGDRRRYWMPCPHCGEEILLRWRNEEGELNIQWDEKAKGEDDIINLAIVEASAFYECEECGGKIRDQHKTAMLRDGRWIAGKSTAEAGARSYHLSSLFSPVLTFGRIAVEYLKTQATVEGAKAFANGWLAEPYRPAETEVNPAKFRKLEADHNRGEIKGDFRLLGVDVQRDHFVWICRGFDRDGTSWLIDNGTAPAFSELMEIAKKYEATHGVIDTGYRTQEIYSEIYAARPFWFGAKGWDRLATSYKVTPIDPDSANVKGAKASKARINLLHVNKSTWGEEMLKRRSGSTLNWWLYANIDLEYVRQMLSTNYVERVNRAGRAVREWVVAGHRQDHFWDCEIYVLALSQMFGLGGAVMRDELETPGKKKPTKKPRRRSRAPSFWD